MVIVNIFRAKASKSYSISNTFTSKMKIVLAITGALTFFPAIASAFFFSAASLAALALAIDSGVSYSSSENMLTSSAFDTVNYIKYLSFNFFSNFWFFSFNSYSWFLSLCFRFQKFRIEHI
jgi:hypothetical protein